MPRCLRLSGFSPCLLLFVLVLLASACKRQSPAPADAPAAPSGAAAPASAPPASTGTHLQDVIERDPRYMIGISYPPIADRYPNLALALQRYANAARSDLMQAVQGLGQGKPTAPYDLSLAFNQLLATPQLVVIAAEGSSYTGGAHDNPLVARFVWLAQEDRALSNVVLIPDPAAWRDIARQVREQLHTALSQRIDADALAPDERADVVRNAGRMIDDGTGPDPANFSQFEPVLGADGRIAALRFVFPPYQVGPYADGTQTVDIPADVLLPKIAPQYRHLFAGS
ncbi:MAG: DUF3298 domain-containing protein [Luteimonas sp.]